MLAGIVAYSTVLLVSESFGQIIKQNYAVLVKIEVCEDGGCSQSLNCVHGVQNYFQT